MTIQELIKNTKNWLDEYEDFDDRHWEGRERREFRYRVEEQKLILELAEKAEKYRWHDLMANPGDFPKHNNKVLVKISWDSGFSDYYTDYFHNGRLAWHNIMMNGRVISWREIEPIGGMENEY